MLCKIPEREIGQDTGAQSNRRCVINFGTAPPPVAKYDGSTDREHLESLAEEAKPKTAESDGSDPAELLVTSGEAGSLGSTIRGDKTAIELFIAGVCGWEARLTTTDG